MSPRLLVVLLAAVVFFQAVGFGFVWDDNVLILENGLTHSLANVPRFFAMDLWAATPTHHDAPYYRPLVLVDLTLDRALFGLSPTVHHLHSLLWHLAAVWLAAGLLERMLGDARAAAVGAAIFALHPVQIEPVVFVSARNDLMAVAFLLGALLLLDRDEASRSGLLGGGLCVLAAALCKESVLLAPLLLATVSWARTGRPGRLSSHLAVLAALGAYAVMRGLAGVGLPARADADHISAALLPVSAHYAERLLVPLDAAPGMHLAWPPALPWLALVGGLLVVGLLVAVGRRAAVAGLCLFGLTLAPAVAAIASTGAVPDRYLYLPLLGVGLAMGAALKGRILPGGVLAVVLALLSLQAMPVWQDDVTLWTAAQQRWPGAYTAGSLAKVLDDLGDLDGAAALYEQATAPPRVLEESCYNITRIHLKRGDPARLVAAGEAARQAGCTDSPELLGPLSVGYLLICRPEDAVRTADLIESDPTGMAVVVRVAAGMMAGDDGPLQAAIAANPGVDPTPLISQSQQLIASSGCSTDAPPPPPG